MTNKTQNKLFSSIPFPFSIPKLFASQFSSKNYISKKVPISYIKSANHYINLNQPLIKSQLLEDNRLKAGVYMWTN